MSVTRRRFLQGSGLAIAASAIGCKASALTDTGVRSVARTLVGVASVDGAGVHLTRIIGHSAITDLDPFVLLDRIHSSDPAEYVRGFPDHPHRGFETVTVMLEGRIRHRDSRGNHGVITGGGAQWMTAGRGIVHSEIPDQSEGLLSGFQLWVNLPAREKMRAQEYQDLAPARLAEARLSSAGSIARVIAGDAAGALGPVLERATQPLLCTVTLEDDTPFVVDVPRAHNAFVFVHSGEIEIGSPARPTLVKEGSIAILDGGSRIRLRANSRRSVALIAAGRPLHEPIVRRGPFVMNTAAEIEKAFDDYRRGTLDV